MDKLLFLNGLPWYARLPVKWLVFGLSVLIVCFPSPALFVQHVRHWRDPNALVEPDAAALAPLVAELRSELTEDLSARETLRHVERYVHRKIPYEWDWNTWGLADYLPTVTETIEMGKEDCDGRAVVAASLLRNLGFDAKLVTDFAHMWVKTERGETMGPGRRKAAVATDRGFQFKLAGLAELPRAFAYGLAVFPVLREVILLVIAWGLMLSRGGGVWRGAAALALLVLGLLMLRNGGAVYDAPTVLVQLSGVVTMSAGPALLLFRVSDRPRIDDGGIADDAGSADDGGAQDSASASP